MSVFFDISSPRIYGVSYCIESRFQLSVLRLLDEDMLVVNVLDDVDVAILGVYLHDDGFDGGVAMYKYALVVISVFLVMLPFCRGTLTLLSARHDGLVEDKDELDSKLY
jgi:hypothetical protein